MVLSGSASGKISSETGPYGKIPRDKIPSDRESARKLGLPGAYWSSDGGGEGFSCDTTLTKKDKELVKAATGWDIDADPDGNTASEGAKEFAGRLNMERFSVARYGDPGNGLTSEITSGYLQGLIQEQLSAQHDQMRLPLDVLYKAQSIVQTWERV